MMISETKLKRLRVILKPFINEVSDEDLRVIANDVLQILRLTFKKIRR